MAWKRGETSFLCMGGEFPSYCGACFDRVGLRVFNAVMPAGCKVQLVEIVLRPAPWRGGAGTDLFASRRTSVVGELATWIIPFRNPLVRSANSQWTEPFASPRLTGANPIRSQTVANRQIPPKGYPTVQALRGRFRHRGRNRRGDTCDAGAYCGDSPP